MNIGLDMMGGDYAPLEAVKGIQQYLSANPQPATLFCIGDEQQVQPLLIEHNLPADAIRMIHAPEVIGYNEHPTKALKEKQQSSIAIGFHLLASGKIDAFLSAGNTGAMLVGTMYTIKPIEGILRPHHFYYCSQNKRLHRFVIGCRFKCRLQARTVKPVCHAG